MGRKEKHKNMGGHFFQQGAGDALSISVQRFKGPSDFL